MASESVPASEFGGSGGSIAPDPHVPNAAEQARLERSINPADPDDNVEAARVRASGEGQ